MKKERKPNIKPAVNIKPAQNVKPGVKQERKGQNKLMLYFALLLLLVLLSSLMVPVYYVPLFKNISARYGLSVDIARQLTLLDLALNSLGVETPNMAAAFQKQNIEYEPDVFYTSRFSSDGKSRLINAKETYYHEYERTKKRPAEIAGIYQNGKEVNTPEIDGDLKGIRALPKGDFLDDDFSYDKSKTVIKNEIMGSKRRQVRGSFDRDGEDQPSNNREPLPDFAASIYNQNEKGETQTLDNSRMVKPDVSEQPFTVVKAESAITKIVGNTSFTDTFATLRNFGGYGGVLGYYIKDDLPKGNLKENLFDFFGNSGRDVFTSYFYSHAAVDRKYIESSKHLAEIAFHGDEPQDEILVARGQKNSKVPTMDGTDVSPISLILTVKRNMKECEDGRKEYERVIKQLKRDYEKHKKRLKDISKGPNNSIFEGLKNVAEKGVPGSCVHSDADWKDHTYKLRTRWNDIVDKISEKCKEIERAEKDYAESCQMEYKRDSDKDDCDSLNALKVDGGTPWMELNGWVICRRFVKWYDPNFSTSKIFHGCNDRQDCIQKEDALFKAIDTNILLEAKPGFVFN